LYDKEYLKKEKGEGNTSDVTVHSSALICI